MTVSSRVLLWTTCSMLAPWAAAQTAVQRYQITGVYADAMDTVQDLTSDGVPEIVTAGRTPVGSYYGARLIVEMYDGRNGTLLGRRVYVTSTAGSHRISVANLGDADGDGFDDLAVGDAFLPQPSPFSLFPIGIVRVLSARLLAIDPATAQIASFGSLTMAPGHDVSYGWEVARVGDLNNDGLADVAIGAPGGPHPSSPDIGRVELVSLGVGGPTLLASFDGTAQGDRFGEAIEGLGLYDCDQAQDYAIGAPGAQTVQIYSGFAQIQTLSLPLTSFGASLANLRPDPPVGQASRFLAVGSPNHVCGGGFSGAWDVWESLTCSSQQWTPGAGTGSCALPAVTTAIDGFHGDFCGAGCASCTYHFVAGDPATGTVLVKSFSPNSGYCFSDISIPNPAAGSPNSFGAAVAGFTLQNNACWVAVSDPTNATVDVFSR